MRSKFYESTRFFTFFAVVFFFVLGSQTGFAQENITVSGTVTDASDGMPVPGASVILRGDQTKGTSTDFDGNFVLEVPSNAVLQVSYIGYSTLDVEVNGQTTLTIQIEASVEALGEVVVVGYGVQKKELTTGANLQVEGAALQKQSTTNALQAMQGQAAGVQITSTSGQPGESMNVVIRGLGSAGSNAPLYVVDGVQTGDISYLNNADIESISVLKDAASAAIYGSQAANGVVLVTTKKGKEGKTQITFDQFYGVQTLAKKIDMLNAPEYMTIINESRINSGLARQFSDEDIANAGAGTDWMDEMFTTAPTENYTLGVTGGNEMSTYSSSLSYLNQAGIVGGKDYSYYERYNFRFNSEHKLYKDKIKFGENFSFAWINNNGIGVGNQYNNSLRGAFQTNPLFPMYDANGAYFNSTGYSEPWLQGVSNPYAQMVYSNQNESDTQKLIGNVYFDFELAKGLNFRTNLGIDYYASQGHSFSPIYELSIYAFSNLRSVNQNMSKGKSMIWTNLLTYNFDLGEDHHFETMLGTEAFKYDGHFMSGSNVDLIYDDLNHAWLSNATNADGTQISLSGGPNPISKRMSYFGRLNYNYKGKLLLNATFRADGSSQFARGNRWGYFPSVSAGWVISREDFMGGVENWMNYLKLRGSWGQVGNQNVGNFQFLGLVRTQNTNYSFGDEEGVLTPGAYPYRLPNSELQWETAEELDFGFDARFFNSKLTLAFDWYRKEQKDWLVLAPIPAIAGAEAPYINGGSVVNSGVEVVLGYNGDIGDEFSYNFSFNGAYNKNEVGEIPTEDGIIHGLNNQLWDNSQEFYRAEDGHPLGYFWGYETAGVFQTEADVNNYVNSNGELLLPDAQPGDLIYVDHNGDGVINGDDRTEIGDPNPDFTYGFSLGFNYKAFDFAMQANGVAGNQIVQSYRNTGANQNWTGAILDRWHGPGSSNTLPRVTVDNRNYNQFSDIFVHDGDFLRISTVTLGYDIAKGIKSKTFFAEQLRIYASVLNLYTFTSYDGMDPEVGFGISDGNYNFSSGVDVGYYPRPRTYMLGVNFKF
ncbi:TonB-dependent receptor [Mangrovimonas sp. AS39]|uniref:SusC/RagA family TonB-linked outer membrane protein n=1 Tax=Mangrovimonas futianensis TaxID=2895523 RepID=UPI001E624AA4|nr:TonB-dependent receptor [Mangrovimonas futianensis]MCF1192188.1 TonB-dependent receptor [Mangrovimonas futianensis]MCF1196063.1 TonB-dependent receptor [Mangrovimonas futianensis]